MRCDLGEGLAQPRRWTRRRRAAMIDSVAEGTSDRNCDVLVHGRRGLDAASARVGSSGTRRRRRRSISRSTDSTCSRPRTRICPSRTPRRSRASSASFAAITGASCTGSSTGARRTSSSCSTRSARTPPHSFTGHRDREGAVGRLQGTHGCREAGAAPRRRARRALGFRFLSILVSYVR